MRPTDEELIAFLQSRRRSHYYCEDCWYTCPKHPEGCCNDHEPNVCNCGADQWNAEVEAMITRLQPQSGGNK